MPEKYAFYSKPEIITERYGISDFGDYRPNYNIVPSHLVPAITSNQSKAFEYFFWGISPVWAKNKSVSKKLTQVPLEDLTSKASLQRSLASNRCLIPANGYFDWKNISRKRKTPYWIYPADKKPIVFAGLWENFSDEKEPIRTLKIITIPPIEALKDFSSRMPVILSPKAGKEWLKEGAPVEELTSILAPPEATQIACYSITPLINTTFDGPEVLEHSQPVDQFGNYTLFD